MKRTTFIIGILLGLALIAGACRGCQLDETAAASRTAVLDTGVKGEDVAWSSHIPEGFDSIEIHDDPTLWMDWINYEKYFYPAGSAGRFVDNCLYRRVDALDTPVIVAYAGYFAEAASASKHLEGMFDFDPSCLDTEDWVCLEDYRNDPVPAKRAERFTLCIFDAHSGILYVMDFKW